VGASCCSGEEVDAALVDRRDKAPSSALEDAEAFAAERLLLLPSLAAPAAASRLLETAPATLFCSCKVQEDRTVQDSCSLEARGSPRTSKDTDGSKPVAADVSPHLLFIMKSRLPALFGGRARANFAAAHRARWALKLPKIGRVQASRAS
jgi:hypothetical protein